MARKKRRPEESARREKIRELLQMANIDSMDDIQNLFKETQNYSFLRNIKVLYFASSIFVAHFEKP